MSAVKEHVAQLAAEVRDLKASLSKQGLAASAINQHASVLFNVAELRNLKEQLDSGDPSRDEAYFARQQAEKEDARRQHQSKAEAQRQLLKAADALAAKPLVQRKIYHLFHHKGSGPEFHYEPPPRFNSSQCGFGAGDIPNPPVYVTEKWDGTTMQATSTHVFKRIDLWGKRQDGKNASDRYELRLLAWRGEDTAHQWHGLDFIDADARIAKALQPYLPQLTLLDPELCVYFEAVHTEINTTFRHLHDFADIRVFDFSRATGFLPFSDTIELASRLRLPLVGWKHYERLDETAIWAELQAAASQKYATVSAPLEGFVLREAGIGERVAKARVEHIHAGEPGTLTQRDLKHGSEPVFTYADKLCVEHLVAIGLMSAESAHRASPLFLVRSKQR